MIRPGHCSGPIGSVVHGPSHYVNRKVARLIPASGLYFALVCLVLLHNKMACYSNVKLFYSMNCSELREELGRRGAKKTGRKAELIER